MLFPWEDKKTRKLMLKELEVIIDQIFTRMENNVIAHLRAELKASGDRLIAELAIKS